MENPTEDMKISSRGVDDHGRETISLDDVVVGDRIRADLGDINELAESVRDNGLLQPIVLDDKRNLVAGGRRFTAFTLLARNVVPNERNDYYRFVPFTRLSALEPSQRKLLEIEENVRRKDMSWQEKTIGIVEYHKLKSKTSAAAGDKWSQAQTGSLLGVDQSSVSIAFTLAAELKDKESPFWKLDTAFEAMKLIAQRKLDEASVEQVRRMKEKRALMPEKFQTPGGLVSTLIGSAQPVSAGGPVTPQTTVAKETISKEYISTLFMHGNCLEALRELAKVSTINHIITDPPYAIDMGQLVQDSVSRIEETHRVEPNKTLLKEFLQVAFDVIAADGFLCMWYDLDMHQSLSDWAEQVGWKVCRWPFTWCKTTNCQNNSAMYNITKATEHCMFLRRSTESVIKKKQSKNWLTAPAITSGSHPFVKPHDVWAYLIETVSLENQTVVDPFCGEGSMLIPALRMNRQPLGIEVDEKHIANGINWLYGELNQQANTELITDESKIPF